MKLMELLRESQFTYAGEGHGHDKNPFNVWYCKKCKQKVITDVGEKPEKVHKCGVKEARTMAAIQCPSCHKRTVKDLPDNRPGPAGGREYRPAKCQSCGKKFEYHVATHRIKEAQTNSSGLNTIKKELDKFDWSYQFSDDFGWWSSGNKHLQQIKNMIKAHLAKNPQDKKEILAYALNVQSKKFKKPLPFNVDGLTEAQLDSPGIVMKKAQLAKTRADMSQLTQKQRTLGQSRKNTKDTPTRRRLSKQIADLGVKKANLGIKTADMSKEINKSKTNK